MFDFFKTRPTDVKGIRQGILQFIKDQLQKAEGGEGSNIKGLCLYITCTPEEKHLYEGAVYVDDENRFKDEEVQKIADDYAIALPENWTLETSFVDEAPDEALRAENVDVALYISTRKKPKLFNHTTAIIKILSGEAEQPEYILDSKNGKVNIGRERRVQTADGFVRENHIAFPDNSENHGNKSISRQHAHIEWDSDQGAFIIYADEGGVPPYNKMKVRAEGGVPIKLQTPQIGHRLNEGDQVILGESAVLEYRSAK